jgi:hypothetical protein
MTRKADHSIQWLTLPPAPCNGANCSTNHGGHCCVNGHNKTFIILASEMSNSPSGGACEEVVGLGQDTRELWIVLLDVADSVVDRLAYISGFGQREEFDRSGH